jgi:hypothetical protein
VDVDWAGLGSVVHAGCMSLPNILCDIVIVLSMLWSLAVWRRRCRLAHAMKGFQREVSRVVMVFVSDRASNVQSSSQG